MARGDGVRQMRSTPLVVVGAETYTRGCFAPEGAADKTTHTLIISLTLMDGRTASAYASCIHPLRGWSRRGKSWREMMKPGYRRNLQVLAPCIAVLGVMCGIVIYSPTLYRMFCAATGYGGTTQRVLSELGDYFPEDRDG